MISSCFSRSEPTFSNSCRCSDANDCTAVQSLASEHLQELENVGSEREKQEEIIKVTTGSMYSGEALYYNGSGTWDLLDLFSAGSDTVSISYNPVRFLLSPIMKSVSSMTSFFLALALFP